MGGKGSGRRTALVFIPDPSRVVWDRQPEETDKAWAAFVIYREMGSKRSIAEVVRREGKIGTAKHQAWSAKYGWRYRIEEFERDQDRKTRARAEQVRLAIVEKQTKAMLKVTEAMWLLAGKDLALWHEKINAHYARIKKAREDQHGEDDTLVSVEPLLSPADIKNLADAGMKLQRLLEEKPTEIGEQRAQITIEDRRRRLQRGLADPDVRDAMRLVTEKLGTADAGGQ